MTIMFSKLIFSVAVFLFISSSSSSSAAGSGSGSGCVACLAKNGSIRDENHETLVSAGKVFEMGFFGNQNRYVGIWYFMDPETIVWVASRDKPIRSSLSVVTVEDNGNLVVKDKSKKYFTSSLPSTSGSGLKRTLKLLDTGNLILVDDDDESVVVWSSFSFPTDTVLPGMYIDNTTKLTSWKSQHNPATGKFVFQKDQVFGYNNYTIFNGKKLHWKSGFGLESNINPTKMPMAALHLLSSSSSNSSSNISPSRSRLVMNSSGEIQLYYWDLTIRRWVLNWSEPKDFCARYNACEPNSSCNISKTSGGSCECLPGFDLVSESDTLTEEVCKRTTTICSGNDTNFLSLDIMKIDVTFQTFLESKSESECKQKCLGLDCCQAYSYNGVENKELVLAGVPGGKHGCWVWSSGSQLVDVQISDGVSTGHKINIRNPVSLGIRNPQGANGNRKRPNSLHSRVIILFAMVVTALLLLFCIGFICYKRRINIKKGKGSVESDSVHEFNESVRQVHELLDPFRIDEADSPTIGVPFFDFDKLSTSTNYFSKTNKLGEGGFGPVYKVRILFHDN